VIFTPGEVTVASDVPSPAEGCARTLRVFVPTEVRPRDLEGVLVLLDGQNLFSRSRAGDYGTWAADDAMEALVARGAIAPWAVVGVDHRGVDRIADDSPWPDARMAMQARGELFARFLVEDLPAWIGRHLPVGAAPTRRALGGSSLGGLMALYVAWRHPLAYGDVAAFSPSVMWSDGRLAASWTTRGEAPRRLYLDSGLHERFDGGGFVLDYGAAVRDFGQHLRGLGWGDDALRVVLDPAGRHDETSWGRRFPDAMRWLLASARPSPR
jgi:predicted alpha/beta superfamily hydrolase